MFGVNAQKPKGQPAYPKVSVIIPCRNEKDYISSCIHSVLNNGYPGELEVLVIDGMSQDGTRKILYSLQEQFDSVKVLDNPSTITPVAMNIGIKAAKGDIIVRVDAHCEVEFGYIPVIIDRLLGSKTLGCVGGITQPQALDGIVEESIAAVLGSRFGVGNSYFRTESSRIREVDTVAFGAYRRELFDEIGYFDERLLRNQDIEFNTRLRRAGYKIVLDPSKKIYYRPRRTIRAFAKQNFNNGYWNIITWKLVPGSLSWRHFVPLAFVSSLILLGLGGFFLPILWYLFWVEISIYGLVDIFESFRLAFLKKRGKLLLTFLVFPILHFSYGMGSLWGICSLFAKRLKKLLSKVN